MDAETQLMQRVKSVCSPWIMEAVAGTPYPAALLAALTANESGGDVTKTRPEPGVLLSLAQIIIGTRDHFGSITRDQLIGFLPGGEEGDYKIALKILPLVNLATSWGPTQIMGYQALAGKYDLAELTSLQTHFHRTVQMLEDFRGRFKFLPLAPHDDGWSDYFRCWNTGSPTGKTFDPMYVPNGLTRMLIYETL